jgi:hypothetical protein
MNPIKPFHADFDSPEIPKEKSIKKINIAKITEATTTIIVLFCNSFHVGHETLCLISLTVSSIYSLNLDTVCILFARAVGFEPTTNGFGDHYSTS